MIERIAPFVLQGAIFRNPEVLSSVHGIRFEELLAMQELGLIAGTDGIGLQMEWRTQFANPTGYLRLLRGKERILLVKHPDPEKTLTLNVFLITTMGQQVIPLANAAANEQWLRLIGQEIKAKGFEVSIGGCRDAGAGFIRAENLTVL